MLRILTLMLRRFLLTYVLIAATAGALRTDIRSMLILIDEVLIDMFVEI